MSNTESEWALSQVQNEADTILFRKKLAAKTDAKCNPTTHVVYLTFGCKSEPTSVGFYTKEDQETLEKIEAIEVADLESKTGAELVAVVSAWRMCDYILYCDDPDLFLDSAIHLRDSYPQFQIGCECNPDPEWGAYDDLPPAADAG